MECSTTKTFVIDGEEVTTEEYLIENISHYVNNHPNSTNTQLFSVLALLSAYVPGSYLLKSQCQQILGPPDPIHGGPPFEERMEPFTCFINKVNLSCGHICLIHQMSAQRAVELLADVGISRSAMVGNLFSLCGHQAQPDIIQFIKDLLTKREMGENGKEKFSRLIEHILKHENFYQALRVLRTASYRFKHNPVFPQTVSRLNYIAKRTPNYERAEEWANKAIERAPDNSYVADTLGQIYKNRLMREAKTLHCTLNMTEEALGAFKEVEEKAEREEGPEMADTAGTVSTSKSFNNRGLFGFIQVAKIVSEKLYAQPRRRFIQTKQREVKAKFDFFEWYLTYSKPDMTTSEPSYFWKDVALCYKYYTTKTAAESTSFPGLLDCLNHGLFTSKGRRAGFEENEKTVSDLEAIHDDLKTTYEKNVDDVKVAERYILSNIILSNRMPDSSHLTPVRELQTIIHGFLGTDERHRSPEFCLLVLLLFWPEEQPQVVQEEDDEEVDQQATECNTSEDKTWEDEDSNEEQETRGEPAQVPLDHMVNPDLQQYVTFMEEAYERAKYAKYLRGRYLLPLFFLGKGSGLSKWIHKSRLDAIVERKVDTELADEQDERSKKKVRQINDMWINGEVWQVPEIQDILLPVRVEPCHSSMTSQEHEEQEVFVCVGEKKIKASTAVKLDTSEFFYLGFTIRGPVLFKGGVPHMSGQ
ncbi:sterile alpha motif domain-containing protein 9-like [Trachinotus anak]|uniref:sterile alpha motif domain-containing protein 9-like n=1 Tax=Trachinotus anak TaxID=443729 RepID=UPI0039F1A57A